METVKAAERAHIQWQDRKNDFHRLNAPRVCVQCLGCYNDGRLSFEWVEVSSDLEEFQADLKRAQEGLDHVAFCNAEEFEWADLDNVGRYSWQPWEAAALCQVVEVAQDYNLPVEAVVAVVERHVYFHRVEEGDTDIREAFEEFSEGVHDNFSDWVLHRFESTVSQKECDDHQDSGLALWYPLDLDYAERQLGHYYDWHRIADHNGGGVIVWRSC